MRSKGIWALALFILTPGVGLAQKIGPQGACPQIYLTSHENDKSRSDSVYFSATKIQDLQIHVALNESVQGEQILHLKLFTPDNHLYQELTQPLTTASQRNGSLRTVAGFPRPLRVQPVNELDLSGISAQGVTIPFPVAGTNIVSSGLYGTWRIEAYLNDETTPCGQSHKFVIQP